MPKVSVVMSVYNSEPFIRDAINSILGQTFQDFEFIIINDGSTDGSLQIIQSYGDSRIRITSQENLGLTKSLNKGIGMSVITIINGPVFTLFDGFEGSDGWP